MPANFGVLPHLVARGIIEGDPIRLADVDEDFAQVAYSARWQLHDGVAKVHTYTRCLHLLFFSLFFLTRGIAQGLVLA